MKKILILIAVLAMGFAVNGTEVWVNLASPDGRLVAQINPQGESYALWYDGTLLFDGFLSPLKRIQNGKEVSTMTVRKTTRRTVDETIASPFTRQATMRNHYNEMTFHMKEGFSVVFRVYNEGFAYRYQWEGKPGLVKEETIDYDFDDDWLVTAAYVTNFDSTNHNSQYSSSFENQYVTLPLSQLDPRRLCFLPLLVHHPSGLKICLTESSLCDYPGTYFKVYGRKGLLGEHAPLPKRVEQGGHNNLQLLVKERETYIAEMDKTKHFPWRITMVAESSAALAMNNMSYLLAEPSRVEDISWIKPGKVAWDWWNNWNIGGVDFKAGVNNDTYKHYIDFASRYGIEYVILDEGWAVNKQADLFQVVPEIDLPMLVNYAKERNVGIILWAGYYAFERDMEKVCKHYSEMGVKGFKVDFMDRDDQLVTDFYRRTAEMCAKYHLVVDFHGAFKPAGLNRTYPNVLNFEGVFGLEQMKWAPSTVDQMKYDTEIPFIRQAAGPMDYTQGAMHNSAKGCYSPCWSEPMSQGTRCHQLALYIVLESPLNMLCDSPTNYDREPDYTRFVAGIPTVWDDTRVLQGEVGEYIVTARRKGSTWYIGGITNWTPRDVEVDIQECVNVLMREWANADAAKADTSRQGSLSIKIELYTDGANAHRKGSDYRHENNELRNINSKKGADSNSEFNNQNSKLQIHMAPGGGFVVKITAE
ncbi:MAG: glycoside hydrolase family 97 protein [Bacteroidales bacterium]|nr:glycoside hydrolase family 97 protein [Bacteroidales bacterium]